MPNETVTYTFTADTTNLTEGLNKAKDSIKNFDTQAGKVDGSITKTTGIVGKLAGAFVGLQVAKTAFGFLKDGIETASTLSESLNVVNQTFGENADAIDQWTKTLNTQFGLTEVQGKKYVGTLGAMLKGSGLTSEATEEMSKKLTTLVGDVSSFYNLPHDQAYTAIKSVVTGETESLKELGIVMTQANLDEFARQKNIGKTVAQMTEQEKLQLRYNFVLEATADAQGDFARTSDGYANQLRIIGGTIQTIGGQLGSLLLPVLEKVNSLLITGLTNISTALSKINLGGFFDQIKSADFSPFELLTPVLTTLSTVWENLNPKINNFIVALQNSIGTLTNTGNSGSLLSNILSILSTAFNVVINVITLAIQILGSIIGVILNLATTALPYLTSALNIVSSVFSTVISIIGSVINIIVMLISKIVPLNSIIGVLQGVLNVAIGILGSFINIVLRVINSITQLVAKFTTFISTNQKVISVISTLGNAFSSIIGVASSFVSGFINTIISGFNRLISVVNTVKGAIGGVADAAKSAVSKASSALNAINPFNYNGAHQDFARVQRTSVVNNYNFGVTTTESITASTIYKLKARTQHATNAMSKTNIAGGVAW